MLLSNLSSGMPLCVSKPHGGTVRCIGLDERCLVTGCADHVVRVWLTQPDHSSSSSSSSMGAERGRLCEKSAGQQQQQVLFNLAEGPQLQLRTHTGPVSSLCLTQHALYSGSWDFRVCVWDRRTWECSSVLTFDDWVTCVAARGSALLVSAGPLVYVHDMCTGQIVRKFQPVSWTRRLFGC